MLTKMGCCSIELSILNLVLLAVIFFSAKKLIKLFNQWKVEKMLERWDVPSKNKVIFHNLWRCKALPNLSPYGLKLETYLKMAKIPYEMDTKDVFGPLGKFPWISVDGRHVPDSQLCIEFLTKKYNIKINEKFTREQLATARACRILLENHFIYGVAWYRFVEDLDRFANLARFPTILRLIAPRRMKKRLEAIGIGLHTPAEIYQLTADDLRSVSVILGNKKFICGNDPCEDDSAIFGVLAQSVWGVPGSCFETLVHEELTNLKGYCERMRDEFWPDWNSQSAIS